MRKRLRSLQLKKWTRCIATGISGPPALVGVGRPSGHAQRRLPNGRSRAATGRLAPLKLAVAALVAERSLGEVPRLLAQQILHPEGRVHAAHFRRFFQKRLRNGRTHVNDRTSRGKEEILVERHRLQRRGHQPHGAGQCLRRHPRETHHGLRHGVAQTMPSGTGSKWPPLRPNWDDPGGLLSSRRQGRSNGGEGDLQRRR